MAQGLPTTKDRPAAKAAHESVAGPSPTDLTTSALVSRWIQSQAEYEYDLDSTLGDEPECSTASLSASVMEYRVLHGRTYHSQKGNTDYWEPNDEKQANSMDLYHHTLTLLFNDKLYLAPIGDNPAKVLDIGCGTGTWAIDFADAFPKCEVIGTDISPIQPHWVPVNLRFEIDNCTATPWTFVPNSFDFVHMRYLFGAIRDWDELYAEAFRACRPGAWAEAVEPSIFISSDDGSVSEGDGSALSAWAHLFREANRKYGEINQQGPRPLDMIERDTIATGFRRAGFVDIVKRTVQCPLAPYAGDQRLKEVGMYGRAAMEEGMEGFVLYLYIKGLGWSHEQVTVYLSHLRRELRDTRKKPYIKVQAVYGRKPTSAR